MLDDVVLLVGILVIALCRRDERLGLLSPGGGALTDECGGTDREREHHAGRCDPKELAPDAETPAMPDRTAVVSPTLLFIGAPDASQMRRLSLPSSSAAPVAD